MKEITRNEVERMLNKLGSRCAYEKGLNLYALEMLEFFFEESVYCSRNNLNAPELSINYSEFEKFFLNGADNWRQSSEGGCFLVYDSDICDRLCNKTEQKKYNDGKKLYKGYREWIDLQSSALSKACHKLFRALKSLEMI